jgi:hypothetical protein
MYSNLVLDTVSCTYCEVRLCYPGDAALLHNNSSRPSVGDLQAEQKKPCMRNQLYPKDFVLSP